MFLSQTQSSFLAPALPQLALPHGAGRNSDITLTLNQRKGRSRAALVVCAPVDVSSG
jgi:hypothetical protein